MSPRLIVAVCTNRTPQRISPTLEELRRQLDEIAGAAGLVVTSGVSGSQHDDIQQEAERFGFECIRVALAGLSLARNAGLGHAHLGGAE